MANPKYANLPGIVYDQPDVFETHDVPESNHTELQFEDETDAVDRENIDPKAAHAKFKNKSLEANGVDFSDRISHNRRTGYRVLHGDYELAAQGDNETAEQKYQRLRIETEQLIEELNNIQDTSKDEKKSERESASALLGQVNQLQNHLQNLHFGEVLGTQSNNATDPLGTLQKKLLNEMDNLGQKKQQQTAGKTSSNPAKLSDSRVQYELFFNSDLAKFDQTSKVSDLEQRLRKIETFVSDRKEDKFSMLSRDTNERSVRGAIETLNAKLSLLDSSNLDAVEAKLHNVGLRLNQIGEKKTGLIEADKQNKVAELYDLLKRTESLCADLPEITTRLITLKDLHEQALQFSVALSQIDLTQQKTVGSLQNSQALLKELQENMTKNMVVIQNNVVSMESRINALKKL